MVSAHGVEHELLKPRALDGVRRSPTRSYNGARGKSINVWPSLSA